MGGGTPNPKPKPGRTMRTPRPTRYISKTTLKAAWKASRDCKASAGKPGIDRITAAHFASDFENNLSEICRLVKNEQYRFHKLRSVFIPKPNSTKERLICIPTVRDRLVQRCIAAHLEKNPRITARNDVAHGFIKGRGVATALNTAIELRGNYAYAIKTDICSFFDCIPRQYVQQLIRKKLGSSSLIPILDQVIGQEIAKSRDHEKVKKLGIKAGVGIRQGMPLSPLLSNIALSEFDEFVDKKGIKMIRYADDIIAFFHDRNAAEDGFNLIQDALRRLNLSLPPLGSDGKSRTYHPSEPIEFLGREIVYSRRSECFVQNIYKTQSNKIRGRLLEVYALDKLTKERSDFVEAMKSLNLSISAYLSAYKRVANVDWFASEMHALYRDIIRRIFKDLFGADAVDVLDEKKKRFLGLEVLQLRNDLETEFGEY